MTVPSAGWLDDEPLACGRGCGARIEVLSQHDFERQGSFALHCSTGLIRSMAKSLMRGCIGREISL
jgi:hypothetical protein